MPASPYKTTVSAASETFDLTILATVKAELGIPDATETYDDALETFITQASRACATYCNRVFAEETLVDSFRLTSSTDKLLLSRMPVSSITSVVEDGTTLAADEYEFEAATGFLWRLDGDDNRSCWSCGKIVVTFVAGYELLETLPHDVERACIVTVKQNYFAKTRDPMVKEVDVPGVERVSYWVGSMPGDNGALPAEAEALLDPFRIIAV